MTQEVGYDTLVTNGVGMQRYFFRNLIISFIFVSLISIIYTTYINAITLAEDAESYRAKGYEEQERGEIDSAITWYQKAADLDPTYPAPHNDLGILFEAKGWLDRAESAYQKALLINPDYEKAHTNLALLYERRGDLEKAAFHWMKRYRLGKVSDPWTKEAKQRLEKLGLLEKKGEEKVEVEKYEREVIAEKAKSVIKEKKSKEQAREWTKIGAGSKKRKDKEDTIKVSKDTTKVSKPKESNLDKKLQESLRLAEERLRREKTEKAKLSERSRTKSEPDVGARSYYLKAHSYYKKGEYSRALDTIRTAKKDYPEESSLLALEKSVKNKMKGERIEDYYNEGIMRYRQNDFSGARKEFEAILNILPE